MILASALDAIGDTPLLALDRINTGSARLLAKAELLQRGGASRTGRPALFCWPRADGRLRPGMPVVEMTSGNMGAGLAVACSTMGHPLIVTMSAGNSPARARMLEALGAEVVIVPQVDGAPGQVTGLDIDAASRTARELAVQQNAFYVDQFNAMEGIIAYEMTGAEILKQAESPIDGWVAAVGSGCTFMGVARALRSANPAMICAAVEPAGCRPLAGEPIKKPKHVLQGTGYGLIPRYWHPS